MVSTSWETSLCSTEWCGSPHAQRCSALTLFQKKNALVLKHMSSLFEFSDAQPIPANHMIIH